MAVKIPFNDPRNSFTENISRNYNTLQKGAILHRWRFNTAITFQDLIARTNSVGFGYVLEGTGPNGARVRLGTSSNTQGTSFSFTPTIGVYHNVFTTWDFTDSELLFHYLDGADLTSGGVSLAGDSPINTTWVHEIFGSAVSPREYEHDEWAVWDNILPTPADIAAYQSGTPLESLSVPPTRLYRPTGVNGAYVDQIADANNAANLFEHSQGPASGGQEPVYSGAVNSITVQPVPRVIGCTGLSDSATFTIEGTYSGVEPDDLQIRVTSGGVPLAGFDWQSVDSFSSNSWQHTIAGLPAGASDDEYIISVRSLDAVDAEIALINSGITNVGLVGAMSGQSNALFFESTPTPPNSPMTGAFYQTGATATQGGNGLQALANEIVGRTGKACLLYMDAQGGAPIANLVPGSTFWDDELEPLIAESINLNFFAWIQGEANAGGDMVAYATEWNKILPRLLTISGQTAENFTFLEVQTGKFNDTYVYNDDWVELRETQKQLADDTTGAYFAATTIDADYNDEYHYSTAWYSTDLAPRIAKSYAHRLGLSANNGVGPILQSFYIDGSDIRARVDLNGATGLVSTGSGDLTGLKLWTDGTFTTQVTISSSSIDGDEIVITPAVAPTENMVLANFRETRVDTTNSVAGTGYDINDIGLQMSEAVFSAEAGPLGADDLTINFALSVPDLSPLDTLAVNDMSLTFSVSEPALSDIEPLSADELMLEFSISSPSLNQYAFAGTSKIVFIKG